MGFHSTPPCPFLARPAVHAPQGPRPWLDTNSPKYARWQDQPRLSPVYFVYRGTTSRQARVGFRSAGLASTSRSSTRHWNISQVARRGRQQFGSEYNLQLKSFCNRHLVQQLQLRPAQGAATDSESEDSGRQPPPSTPSESAPTRSTVDQQSSEDTQSSSTQPADQAAGLTNWTRFAAWLQPTGEACIAAKINLSAGFRGYPQLQEEGKQLV